MDQSARECVQKPRPLSNASHASHPGGFFPPIHVVDLLVQTRRARRGQDQEAPGRSSRSSNQVREPIRAHLDTSFASVVMIKRSSPSRGR